MDAPLLMAAQTMRKTHGHRRTEDAKKPRLTGVMAACESRSD
ncbi:hypothetical protein DA2_0176 [Desulfovibrio sp. A2]|nr:hypothetical protein DA2_0176 [Desulfovibrio sp. A2]